MSLLELLSRERIPHQVPRRFWFGWAAPPQHALRWLRFAPIVGKQALKEERERMRQATHHLSSSPCAWPVGCPTHRLWRIERNGDEVHFGDVCIKCALLNRVYPRRPIFESWDPFGVLDEHYTLDIRRWIELHPANFRAWSTYVAPQPASTQAYR